jgi:hypothetical protein
MDNPETLATLPHKTKKSKTQKTQHRKINNKNKHFRKPVDLQNSIFFPSA